MVGVVVRGGLHACEQRGLRRARGPADPEGTASAPRRHRGAPGGGAGLGNRVWSWITSLPILLGAELNAVLERGRAISGSLPERAEPYAGPRDTHKVDGEERRELSDAERQKP